MTANTLYKITPTVKRALMSHRRSEVISKLTVIMFSNSF